MKGLIIRLIIVLGVLTVITILVKGHVLSSQTKAGAWYTSPTPSREITPSPTETPEQEDNDCLNPGEPDLDHSLDDHPCISGTPEAVPSVSLTPESSPSANVVPQNDTPDTNSTPNKSTSAVCPVPFPAPDITRVMAEDKTHVDVEWFPTNGEDHFALKYGYSPDTMNMGIPTIPKTSSAVEIGAIDATRHVFVQLCAEMNGCEACSVTVDP